MIGRADALAKPAAHRVAGVGELDRQRLTEQRRATPRLRCHRRPPRSRLRPNIVLGGVPGLAERSWPGKALRIGETLIGVQSVRSRCIVTTIDPDTGEQDLDVLRRIHRQFDGTMALNCWVVHGGRIRAGQRADVVDLDVDPPPGGGWITGTPYRAVAPDREGECEATRASPSVR